MKLFLALILLLTAGLNKSLAQSFSMDDVLSYPFPTELTAAAKGTRIAWAFNEKGRRNVYVAEGPHFTPRKLTNYNTDDGQEITSLAVSPDGQYVVYVRGGDHGSGQASIPVNPTSSPLPAKVRIWSIRFSGGTPKLLGDGDYPQISRQNNTVAFLKGGQAFVAPIDGSSAARSLFVARGATSNLQWAPDGSALAFVSRRNDHAFIGIYKNPSTPIKWIAPSFSRDGSPRWSPDSKNIAFIRTPGEGGAPDSILARRHQPWSILTADVATGKTVTLWQAPKTLAGSIPTTDGGPNLNWAADNRIVFVSYHDGWPHLYSIPSAGGKPLLLTPGPFMVEHVRLTPDGKNLLFSANTGNNEFDIDRRHLARVSIDKANMEVLTAGTGLETYPLVTGDGSTIALLSATAQRPLLPAVMPWGNGKIKLLGESLIPAAFPQNRLVIPKHVAFKAPDGQTVYGQLFEAPGSSTKKPAIVYVHGGPQRQMLLGWHHMDYYSIDYAVNQYLASQGFTVLAVNYRLGVGYGYEFHKPANAGGHGASEYQDIKASAEWLMAQPQIDAHRIGIYGGSYGGYLVALALGRDSKLFSAGVDIHGVHTRFRSSDSERTGAPDAALANKIAYESSPVAHVATWTSPVLLIHADDDRNVSFSHSVELARRFEDKGFPFEYLAIPDDTHHWMKYGNARAVSEATAEFLIRKLAMRNELSK